MEEALSVFNLYVYYEKGQPLPEEPIAHIAARNGMFMAYNTFAYSAIVPTVDLPQLYPIEPSAESSLPPIPATILAKTLRFFRHVFAEYGASAVILLYFREETSEWLAIAPPQFVTAKKAEYHDPADEEIPEGFILVGSIHSHTDMVAVHTNRNEHAKDGFCDGVHVTLGRVDRLVFDASAEFVAEDERFPVQPSRVLEGLDGVLEKAAQHRLPEVNREIFTRIASQWYSALSDVGKQFLATGDGFEVARRTTELFLGLRDDETPKTPKLAGYAITLPEGADPDAVELDQTWARRVFSPTTVTLKQFTDFLSGQHARPYLAHSMSNGKDMAPAVDALYKAFGVVEEQPATEPEAADVIIEPAVEVEAEEVDCAEVAPMGVPPMTESDLNDLDAWEDLYGGTIPPGIPGIES
ncbi:MAG: hypothetical protein ABIG71_00580 [Candidatus Uhrbacteria bacterium]